MHGIQDEGLTHYAILFTNWHEHYLCAHVVTTGINGTVSFVRLDTGVVAAFPPETIRQILTGYSLIDVMLRMDELVDTLLHRSRENSLGMVVTASTQVLYV
jgi:hypothetical protein